MAPDSLISTCHLAVLDARGGDPVRGLRVALDAYRRAREHGPPEVHLAALNAMSICLAAVGAHVNALATSIDAYRLAVDQADRRARLHAMLSFTLAAIQLFQDPDSRFFDTIWRCRDEAGALADASLLARAENILGNAHLENGELNAGRHAYERALELLPRTDGTTPEALLLGNLANQAVRVVMAARPEARSRPMADAYRALTLALEKAHASGAVDAELRAHANRGWLLEFEGRHEEALESHREALAIAMRIRHHQNVAEINRQIGSTLVAMNRDADAMKAFRAAEDVAGDIRPAQVLHDVWNMHADALARRGDASAAERARAKAAEESAIYERERAHARSNLDRFLAEMSPTLS